MLKGTFWIQILVAIRAILGISFGIPRVFVKEGIHWSIGDGSKIRVWQDPRLRNNDYMKLQGPIQHTKHI